MLPTGTAAVGHTLAPGFIFTLVHCPTDMTATDSYLLIRRHMSKGYQAGFGVATVTLKQGIEMTHFSWIITLRITRC